MRDAKKSATWPPRRRAEAGVDQLVPREALRASPARRAPPRRRGRSPTLNRLDQRLVEAAARPGTRGPGRPRRPARGTPRRRPPRGRAGAGAAPRPRAAPRRRASPPRTDSGMPKRSARPSTASSKLAAPSRSRIQLIASPGGAAAVAVVAAEVRREQAERGGALARGRGTAPTSARPGAPGPPGRAPAPPGLPPGGRTRRCRARSAARDRSGKDTRGAKGTRRYPHRWTHALSEGRADGRSSHGRRPGCPPPRTRCPAATQPMPVPAPPLRARHPPRAALPRGPRARCSWAWAASGAPRRSSGRPRASTPPRWATPAATRRTRPTTRSAPARTGHNEVVRVVFDPAVTSYEAMLQAVLGGPRPHAGHAPGQRRRHAVPLGDLRLLGRPARGRRGVPRRVPGAPHGGRATARSPPRSSTRRRRSTTPRTTTSSTSPRCRTATAASAAPASSCPVGVVAAE